MNVLHINTGSDAVPVAAQTLNGNVFGARYDSYRSVDRFEAQTDDLNIGLIVWPGGTLAEVRDDRYGLEFEGLYSDATGKPDIADMTALAIETGASLSVVIPTIRYLGRDEVLVAELDGFLQDLLGGVYGPLPEKLILEVGSEYYAHFDDLETSGASQYGAIANTIVTQIVSALEDPDVNSLGADVAIAVQVGKTVQDDEDIRAELTPAALSEIDLLVHHRFSPQPQGFDDRIEELEEILEYWREDSLVAGGEQPDLFVSAWNVASYTRADALAEYLAANPALSEGDIDLVGRTTTDFEQFWQMRLGQHSYGKEHPGAILEAFSSYAEAGMSFGAIFGTDFVHPGRLSWREDGSDHWFVGHEMIEMIYEAVDGTIALASESDYDQDANVRTYAFEGDDRLVVFVAADGEPPDTVQLSVEGLAEDFVSLWVDTLESVENEEWKTTFDIPDNPQVDESNEAETYAIGLRGSTEVQTTNGDLEMSINPYEIIRLIFAKSEEAAESLAGISENPEIDIIELSEETEEPILPPIDTPDDLPDTDEENELEEAHGSGSGSGSGLAALILFPLFFLF